MRRLVLFSASVLALPLILLAADQSDKTLVGIDKRIPWTTSHVQGSPEPPSPYRSERAFPKVHFDEPLDMAQILGSNRLAIVQRHGKLFTFVNDAKTEKADLLLDVKHTVYSLAFHPKFAENGFLYVTYVHDDKETPTGSKVARYHVSGDPPQADPTSEKIIFSWPNGGHNAGCLKFTRGKTLATISLACCASMSIIPTRAKTTACRRTIPLST